MKRATLNLLIDLLAAIFFVGMVTTGYILFFTLPPGTNKSLSLWSLTRHQWGQVDFWISLGFLAVLLLHLTLRLPWVTAVVAQRLRLATLRQGQGQGRPIRSGVITMLAVAGALGLFVWVTEISVREREDPPYPTADALPSDGGADAAKPAFLPPGSAHRFTFSAEVYPILDTSCLRCHGPRTMHGGFRVDRREDYFGRNGNAPLVVPGNSAQSPLIAIVQGRRTDMAMAESHKLPEEAVAVLRAWIDAGAEWPEKLDGR